MAGRVEASRGAAQTVRAMLDQYDVGERLHHIREFIWRGGTLELQVARGADGQVVNVWYALTAEWPAVVLERDDCATQGIVSWNRPVVEGRWVQGRNSYELRVGIDLCSASAIYIRSQGFVSHVPFLNRPPEQVEQALTTELTSYVNAFLDHCSPVPQAAADDAQRLRRLTEG
ncbi:MAG TPA: hypothetical protein VGJ60_01390 [Chloroflexota bacterium]|jgi:hypothetical protein